ncbi:MAG: hypothetical protein R3258_01030 [Acidimicrobiia bacterium]|nr:hypothetical protein [Acidimicrobiia bacterium]
MQRVLGIHSIRLTLAAILLIAASGAGIAHFSSPAPGEDLAPVGGAETLIDLVQGSEAILWKAIEGKVSTHSMLGWPSSDGIHDIGGSLVVERPANPSAGLIQTVEKPQTLIFNFQD